jgi:hypothetical protein
MRKAVWLAALSGWKLEPGASRTRIRGVAQLQTGVRWWCAHVSWQTSQPAVEGL